MRNRELLLDSAQRLFRERGTKVTSLAITEGAGLAAGTLYRHFPTRDDLLAALRSAPSGSPSTTRREAESGPARPRGRPVFLERADRAARRADVMPLHGGPITLDDRAVELRAEISAALDRLLARGREEGSIRADVTSTDVILMGALLAQPLPSAPDWDAVARRQAAIYVAGLRPADGPALPGQGLQRADLERAFRRTPAGH